MAKAKNYSNTHKYNNRRSFDGSPVPNGKVLVPFLKEKFGLQKGDYIQDNFTTMHLGEIPFEIGFMAINEACFASYIKDFWAEINAELEMRREGRCVIGKTLTVQASFALTPDAVRDARTRDFWNAIIRSV